MTPLFDPTLWSLHYHNRRNITKSTFIGDYQNPTCKPSAVSDKLFVLSSNSGTDVPYKTDNHVNMVEKIETSAVFPSSSERISDMKISGQTHPSVIKPAQKRKAESLSYTQLVEITSKLCNASERNKKFGILVSGMMLQLLEIANGNTGTNLGDDLEANMKEFFPQIIDKYKTQFQPSKKIAKFNSLSMKKDISVNRKENQLTDFGDDVKMEEVSVNRDIVVPSKPIGYIHATCRRKKPRVEIMKKKLATSYNNTKTISVENLQFTKINALKPKGTKTSSCGFCGDPGHRISRCGKKKSFGPVQDGSVLSTYLLNTAPFSLLDKNEARDLINDDVSSRRGVKHMIVHSLHMKWQCDPTI